MASTNYKSRIIIREHETGSFAGTYNLLVRAKSMPAPKGAPNNIESTTMEDDAQTFEKGISTNDNKEVTGNLEKAYLDKITKLEGKKVDIIFLYGTDGVGGVAKYAFTGEVSAAPSDVSGTDAILEMTVTIIPNTTPQLVTDKLTVVDGGDGTFTVTAS